MTVADLVLMMFALVVFVVIATGTFHEVRDSDDRSKAVMKNLGFAVVAGIIAMLPMGTVRVVPGGIAFSLIIGSIIGRLSSSPWKNVITLAPDQPPVIAQRTPHENETLDVITFAPDQPPVIAQRATHENETLDIITLAPDQPPVILTGALSIDAINVMKCPECAETIKSEARICRFCGHRLSEEQLQQAKELLLSKVQIYEDAVKKKRLRRKSFIKRTIAWIIILPVALLAFGFIGMFLDPNVESSLGEMLFGLGFFCVVPGCIAFILFKKAKKDRIASEEIQRKNTQ